MELLWLPSPSSLLLEGGHVMDNAAINEGEVMVDEEDVAAVLVQ